MFCALLGQDIRGAFTGPLVLWFDIYFGLLFSFSGRQQHNDYSQGVQNDDNTRETTLLTQ